MLALVDLAQPVAAGVVERCGAHLLEQLLDHRADPHHLRGLLDQVCQRPVVVAGVAVRTADDLDVVVVVLIVVSVSSLYSLFTPALVVACDSSRARRPIAGDAPVRLRVGAPATTARLALRSRALHWYCCPGVRPSAPWGCRQASAGDGRAPTGFEPVVGIHGPFKVAGMAYDVARVRGLIPSLGDGWIHLDAAGRDAAPGLGCDDGLHGASARSISTRSARIRRPRAPPMLDAARQAVADLVGADPRGVVLGPTARCCSRARRASSARVGLGSEVVVTRLDDEANVAPWLRAADRFGAKVRWAEVDIETGELPAWQYEGLMSRPTRLVAIAIGVRRPSVRPSPICARSTMVHEVDGLVVVDRFGRRAVPADRHREDRGRRRGGQRRPLGRARRSARWCSATPRCRPVRSMSLDPYATGSGPARDRAHTSSACSPEWSRRRVPGGARRVGHRHPTRTTLAVMRSATYYLNRLFDYLLVSLRSLPW